MKITSSWIILYSCLIFGTGIFSRKRDRNDNYKIRQVDSSFLVNTDHTFFCSNGSYIEWSLVCDGHNDCSDGSDETEKLCAIYEFGTNTTMDCGRVNESKIRERQSRSLAPWTVGIRVKSPFMSRIMCYGSIITPNIVISVAKPFRAHAFFEGQKCMDAGEGQTFIDGGGYRVDGASLREMMSEIKENQKNQKKELNVAMIFLTRGSISKEYRTLDFEDLSVLVLVDPFTFGNNGFAPVCIDWNSKYNMWNDATIKVIGIEDRDMTWSTIFPIFRIDDTYEVDKISFKARHGFIPYIDNSTCLNTYQMICMRLEQDLEDMLSGAGISIFHSNAYFLTGVIPTDHRLYYRIGKKQLGLTGIENYVPWIRGIVNKYATMHACVLPSEEGVIYSYKSPHRILSHGTLIYSNLNVTEDCEVGYHKAYSYSFRICQGRGKWFSSSKKLCFKNCPPLLSKNLDIKCTLNGEYANCSNTSRHNTIATASCKSPYTSGAEQEEKPLILICQSNGKWDKQLHECYQLEVCVLPNREGVLYTYKHSDRSTYGKFVNYSLTVRDYCSFGYNDAFTNINIKYEDCPGGNWQTISHKTLCLRLCPPLLSDSLNIKCSYNEKYANCSNLSIPGTIATPSCKPTYVLPSGQIETPIELHCQSNGTWDKQLLYRCHPSSSCVLPTVEGAVYTYENSNESLSHGTFINHTFTVNENCAFGYHNVYPNSFRVCLNGKWKTNSDKLCFKMCPPLLSDSLDIKCSYKGYNVDCSKLSIPDTKATQSCKPTFTLPNGQIETPIELRCQSNGTWNNKLYICDQVCGRPFYKAQILIKIGETANVGTAPWNVAIYEKTSNYYDFKCGGSIISRNLVISAAHCFWVKGMSYNITVFDDLYKIAAGKYYRNLTIYENEFPQIMNVDKIHLQEGYFGQPGYYAEDIAVVVLNNSFSFNNGITPICIDWDGNYNIPNGAEGQIVGWGKTEKDIESTILLKTNLPYFNMTTCRAMCEQEFQSYVTYDKFCAGSTLVSGRGVDGGDSGAGLCFSHSNCYYLTGVASLKDPDAKNSIALFTAVKSHIQWIRELFDHYKKVPYN